MAVLNASTAAAPAAVDRPGVLERRAADVGAAGRGDVIAGRVPPPAVIGALQTLSSVSSDAFWLVTFV